MTRILVAGSGTAGLVTATILKKWLGVDVDVISSKKVDIIGVGEGSTEHFSSYMDFVGISSSEIIKNCGATFKCGIMFEGWNPNKDYLHTVDGSFTNKTLGQYNTTQSKLIIDNKPQYHKYVLENKVDSWFLGKPETNFNQYHFDSQKLNDYLTEFSKGMGIRFIEDIIEEINFSENGDIKSLKGEKSEYNYNFYIDATGFKKVLIGEMGAKWNSYNKYLKMNSAITFQTEEEDEYNLWTLAKAMDAGWLFRIPVQGRYGNGYIFDDNYINEEQAKKEVEKYFGKEIDIGKKFKFDPGALDKSWIKNCCAVGLSSAFVEPLEASSIGTTIQQAFLLSHRITNYNDDSIKRYNKSFNSMMGNIRDFIVLHYVTNRNDTPFWKDVSRLELPETLKHNLKSWKKNMPISEDFSGSSDYILFNSIHYSTIIAGLDIFDMDHIKNEFDSINDEDKIDVINHINKLEQDSRDVDLISHKKFIEMMRDK